VTAAAVTLRFVLPVFFNVSVWLDVLPTTTLPKLKLVGLVVKSPTVTPIPEMEIFTEPLSAVTARLPLELPAFVGPKTTLTAALCPTAKTRGKVTPVML
jgi:hypothetical protein